MFDERFHRLICTALLPRQLLLIAPESSKMVSEWHNKFQLRGRRIRGQPQSIASEIRDTHFFWRADSLRSDVCVSTVAGCRCTTVEGPLKIERKSRILQTLQHAQLGQQISSVKSSVGITNMNGELLETRCCFGCWCGSS